MVWCKGVCAKSVSGTTSRPETPGPCRATQPGRRRLLARNPVSLEELQQDPVVAFLLRQAQATTEEALAEHLRQAVWRVWRERCLPSSRDSSPLRVGAVKICGEDPRE
ncbi:uncharacterized protein LOC143517278 isoform X4 [Brachyhypopomus gauderio]|uniref:uncharacterized protein LOC143517278 isoform X4 n=1 Tax=Brachyhypopomus gauderio TaxID=698409 RepID=UPI00404290F5